MSTRDPSAHTESAEPADSPGRPPGETKPSAAVESAGSASARPTSAAEPIAEEPISPDAPVPAADLLDVAAQPSPASPGDAASDEPGGPESSAKSQVSAGSVVADAAARLTSAAESESSGDASATESEESAVRPSSAPGGKRTTGTATRATRAAAADEPGGRAVSLQLSTLVRGAAYLVLIAAVVVMSVLWWSERGKLRSQQAAADDNAHAEQVAMDYAVGASTVNSADFQSWVNRLKADTSPQLANKFDATAPKLEQILVPLKWNSTASPIASTIASDSGGIYKVNAFVSVNSTSAQTPDGGQTTVTYNVTVDKGSGWKVTDVGGLEGALPTK